MSVLQYCSMLTLLLFFQIPIAVLSFQYKVGDLDTWGVPPPSKSNLYSTWSQNHNFSVGDSLLFLYPPSQDSVIQVTERAYNTCSTSNPILRMSDGNSVFNITAPGNFFFVSGSNVHCKKQQRIEIRVASADGKFLPPAADAAAPAAADGPSYSNAFGPMPMGLGSGSGSGSGSGAATGLGMSGAVGSLIGALAVGILA